ncbi:hypothetical protein EDC04DRAFT_2615210, partial [Pisolithus marmoratus]
MALQDPQYTPKVAVLETFDPDTLLATWNNIFSEKLSPYMHLFGTSEPEEDETYQQHFSAYFDKLISATQGLINTILPTISDNDVTWPALTNLVTKLYWVQLGFHPSNEPLIELDTPSPLFTDLSMVVMLGNWNTTKISICKGDETGLDINLDQLLQRLVIPPVLVSHVWPTWGKVCMDLYYGGSQSILQNHLDIKDTRKQQMCINQFISLLAGNCRVALTEVRFMKAYHTELAGAKAITWQTIGKGVQDIFLTGLQNSLLHTPGLGGPTSLIIFPNTTLGNAIKLLQVTTIWDLCQNIIELFSAFAQQGKSTIAWSHWDGITEQPALNGENPTLALMPTSYS